MKIIIYTTDGERQELEVENAHALYIKHDKFCMSAQLPQLPQLKGSRIELGVQVYENKFEPSEWLPTVNFISGDFYDDSDEEGWVRREENHFFYDYNGKLQHIKSKWKRDE